MKEIKKKKSLLYYYSLVMIMIIIFNVFVFPIISSMQVVQISYSEFLDMVADNKVEKVEFSNEQILLQTKGSEKEAASYYFTGLVPDDNIVSTLKSAGVNFGKVIDKKAPFIEFIFSWIFPIGIFLILGNILSKKLSKNMNSGVMSFGNNTAKIYAETTTGKTFKDVAGQEEAKESLIEIVDFLNHPDKYTKIGARLPKGALLVGPPGTGKTLLAKAVAGEAGVPFFSLSGSDFVEMFVGMGAARVRDLFKQAQEKAPCIIFIDEIDAIGKSRDAKYGGNDEREQTLNQLLTEMDGFDSSKGVVILAATNRPEVLDKALLRPGRFDRRVIVERPDLAGRAAILAVHMVNVKAEAGIDLDIIARATAGAVGADLANIVNEAALRAVRLNRELMKLEDLEECVETVIAGQEKKNSLISPTEKKIVAYHEIGHALVAAMLKNSEPIHKITIIPRTMGALGYTMQVATEEKNLMSKEEAINKIRVLLGGRAAEEVAFDSITTGASNDIERATQLARSMITVYGMSEHFGMVCLEKQNNQYLNGGYEGNYSQKTAYEIDEEVKKIIKTCHDEAKQILIENKGKMDLLAETLYKNETITGEEFIQLL